jgi:hypothetical protein
MTSPEPRYITDREAAKILGYSVQSLRNWRWLRRGPEYIVRGRSIRYSLQSIISWMNEGKITPEEAGR